MDITESVEKAQSLLVQGGSDSLDQTSRNAIASELEQIIEGIKQTANTSYRGSFLFSGTETSTRPYPPTSTPYNADRRRLPGRRRGLDPAVPGSSARSARTCRCRSTSSAAAVPRRRPGRGATTSCSHVLRDAVDHLRAGNGAVRLRGTDLDRLDTNFDLLLEVRAANGAKTNRLEAALGRLSQLEESVLGQLSKTEDADIAETLIDLNSQTAAYQAALRAGASIVQSSLMDFLR